MSKNPDLNEKIRSDSQTGGWESGPRVYLVGAGPGDVGLITVGGVELLRRADVIIYDALACSSLLKEARPNAELIYVGKKASRHSLPQDQINALLIEKARAGKVVVRLKGGDPFVFGRGGEEAVALSQAGIKFEIVPGVTAGVAAAAYAGIPITHRDFASEVAFITGHEAADRMDDGALDWESLGRWKGTLVFYMGVKNLGMICKNLQQHGMNPQTPAAIIRWGTTPRQKVLTATVGTLAAEAVGQDFQPPAITVIGQVVGLRDSLNWYASRPLFGRRIVVTRPRAQSREITEGLERLGADVIEFPVIRIESASDSAPLKKSVSQLSSYHWIVFTSVNGVAAFFDELQRAGRDSRAFSGVRIAAIGPATADSLRNQGIQPDLIPPDFISDAVVVAMAERFDLRGQRVLLPRADLASEILAEQLRQHGAVVEEVVAYSTVSDDCPPDDVLESLLRDDLDWITFASSSAVRHFLKKVPPDRLKGKKVRIASIGPVTSETIRSCGFAVGVEAEQYTIEGLIAALCRKEKPVV